MKVGSESEALGVEVEVLATFLAFVALLGGMSRKVRKVCAAYTTQKLVSTVVGIKMELLRHRLEPIQIGGDLHSYAAQN